MSGKNKNYNSIIFLTTLSVYLGLVLVSGSPQVFAYAATTRNFDIQQEIEFKEDLDNKPDDSCAKQKTKIDEQDNRFLEEYIKLVSTSLQKYPSEGGFTFLDGFGGNNFPSLRKDFLLWELDFKVNNNGLLSKSIIKAKYSGKDSSDFASSQNQSLNFHRCKSQDLLEKPLYENTSVSFVKDQIFIVTRLPRAGIDSLIK